MKSLKSRLEKALILAVGTVCIAFVTPTRAQVQTSTSTTQHPSTQEVTVEHAVVVLVEGNDLVLKMEDGSIRHIPNVPESRKIDVDGRQLGIHDLKPGMQLQHTLVVTTTPQTVTTVQTVTGKIWHVTPPNTVVLTLADNTNQAFTIPKGQKFKVNGEMVDAFALKKGMVITATKIVEAPETVVAHERTVTGTMPPPPPAPPADVPILVVTSEPAPPPATEMAAATPEKLPKTASDLPLIGLLGLLCISVSFGVKFLRTSLGR